MTDQFFREIELALKLGKLFNCNCLSINNLNILINFIYINRAVGGREAEKEERQRWENADKKRIMDSVNSKRVY
jgi:hypothetical protein